MLVLTRRVNEKLVIGNEIIVEVLSVSGDDVRIGITAPREVSVHRFEVFQEIQHANEAASTRTADASAATLKNLAARLRLNQTSDETTE